MSVADLENAKTTKKQVLLVMKSNRPREEAAMETWVSLDSLFATISRLFLWRTNPRGILFSCCRY